MSTTHTRHVAGLVTTVALTASLAWVTAVPLGAQTEAGPQTEATETGAYLFRQYCVGCHGTAGKGDGPLAGLMRRKPADLTEIQKRHDGLFPSDKVFRIIDGRVRVPGHGGPDMPVWGDVFLRSVQSRDPEAVKMRIRALVDFLQSIQARVGF